MKILLISCIVLLLGVSLNSGHYIYQVEKENAPVFEVKENPSGLVLVDTEVEKPTLRDTLFYHLFDRDNRKEEPTITERSFTNSHGYQFLKELVESSSNDEAEPNDKLNDDENQDDEESEPKPLTDKAVKDAYKSRIYLFDQMRQRNDVISPEFLERKKRQAEYEEFPESPRLRTDSSDQEAYVPPKTYGMNLNSDGGYVWNNLNNPPSLFELGPWSNGYQNAGQPSLQSSETFQPIEYASSSEAPVNKDSGSSEDIYVNINKPRARPLENEGLSEEPYEPREDNTETKKEESGSAENPLPPINDSSDSDTAKYPIEPILGQPEQDKEDVIIPDENSGSPLESVNEPAPSNQELKPTESPIAPAPVNEEAEEPQPEKPAETGSLESVEEIVINSSGEGSPENSEGDKVKEIPEAPTLPPLNYDNLPDYIRQAISSTERAGSIEHTDNPFVNPQPSPEDKKEMEDKIIASIPILATAQPVEDIPKTYGMNLTSGSGQDLASPPVSYEVGSTESNRPEEPRETTTQAPVVSKEPVKQESGEEPRIPTEEPAGPEKEGVTEPTANPEENTAPVDLPEVTENQESKESIKPDIQLPETKPDNEESKPNNELPEATSTTEIPQNPDSMPDVKVPDNEEVKPNDDSVVPVRPVEPVRPDEEPQNPEEKVPEAGSGETGVAQKPDGESSEGTEGEVNEPEEPKPEDDANKKPDIMNELLKSELFWKWLGEWTATYMELMEKHIRKIAIQEICNHSKQGIDMCLLDYKPEESGYIIKDEKTINGEENDLSLTNLDKLKRGDKGYTVGATTIYGNAVGNDKVTNVFIFNSNNAKDILEGLKPENDSKVNIIIEDQNKESEEPKGKSDEGEHIVVYENTGAAEEIDDARDENKEAIGVKPVDNNAGEDIRESEVADKVV